jgi:PPOX class probable F420-dependent enzyme
VKLEQLPGWALVLLASERVARLGFVDEDDLPRVLPVTYALAGGAVWSAIDEKPKRTPEPARVRRLRQRPEAALCVDFYSDDWTELAWVQLLGTVEWHGVEEGAEGMSALAAKYAAYAERTPPGPLMRLEVERAYCWRAAGSPRRDHSLQEPG